MSDEDRALRASVTASYLWAGARKEAAKGERDPVRAINVAREIALGQQTDPAVASYIEELANLEGARATAIVTLGEKAAALARTLPTPEQWRSFYESEVAPTLAVAGAARMVRLRQAVPPEQPASILLHRVRGPECPADPPERHARRARAMGSNALRAPRHPREQGVGSVLRDLQGPPRGSLGRHRTAVEAGHADGDEERALAEQPVAEPVGHLARPSRMSTSSRRLWRSSSCSTSCCRMVSAMFQVTGSLSFVRSINSL